MSEFNPPIDEGDTRPVQIPKDGDPNEGRDKVIFSKDKMNEEISKHMKNTSTETKAQETFANLAAQEPPIMNDDTPLDPQNASIHPDRSK